MILVDSSVWIDHLHTTDETLFELLEQSTVSVHPMVIGELALGQIRDRSTVLSLLANLPSAEVAEHREVMDLIESHHLFGRGLSLIDAYLLASAAISSDTQLWTRDKRLDAAAADVGIAYPGA